MRAVSYNILAQRYIKEFSHINYQGILSWNHRLDLILKKIKNENADIILLQEVELNDFGVDFSTLFEEYSFSRHIITKNRDNPIGQVVLWKKDLIPQHTILTSCAVIVEFKTFWVANVHLKARILKGEQQRQTQIRSVLKKVNHQKPGFIAGDFNDYLNSNCLYNVKTQGLIMNELSNYEFKIHSLNNSSYVYNNEYNSHNYWTFDHVLSNKMLISLNQGNNKLIPFPNEFEPSDHLMMSFNFSIKT